MSTQKAVRDYLAEQNPKAKDLADNDSLLEKGLLDSMAIVKLVAFIEERFGLKLSDDEFDPDNFETLNAIAAMIEANR